MLNRTLKSLYTKVYSTSIANSGETEMLKNSVQLWLKKSLEDPIVKILTKNSHLTKTQLETLLIDILAENFSGKPMKYDEKAKLRLTKAKISRGAFNRTLKQAQKNVIKAVYTVLLLGYLGIFESTALDQYIEIANKLQEYINAHRGLSNKIEQPEEQIKILKMLREELESSLKVLSNPSEGFM
ncbi:MAG: hypothetical protein QXQ50_00555 [Candidatus Bathyarchaeia archaeon]